LLKINLAVAATGLESEASAPLAQTAHLQDFGGGKLVKISDQRVTRIDSFSGRACVRIKRGDKPRQD
jgi:hypothetical protein